MEIESLYDDYKPLLFTLAYQLTGIPADAEDAVQDVFVKLHQVDMERLTNPKAYLCKMVTNHCLDYLKSAQKQREQYVGTWLPEPIQTSSLEISEKVIQDDLLSYGMLVVMEKLTPAERAVFVLKEAFGFEYPSIAMILDKSEVNCRKLLSRAREKLRKNRKENFTRNVNHEWMERLLISLQQGNVDQILPLLSDDISIYSDGGGNVPAALRPISSREMVLRFLVGLLNRLPLFGEHTQIENTMLNGEDAILVRADNEILLAALFEVHDDHIKKIYFVRNPDKLKMLE